MRLIVGLIGILIVLPLGLSAGEKTPPANEYAQFSKLTHSIVVKQLPKQFEDATFWGQMTEIPSDLPLMLLRKTVKVGDHLEAPHGPWFRFKGKIEEPDKNLKITVKDFKKLDSKTYRLVVDVDATVACQVEFQQWQKGLLLVSLDGIADANVTAALVCDVTASLNLKKLPPQLDLEPKVSELGLTLVDVKLRGGPFLKGEKAKVLAGEFKELLRGAVKASEPLVKEYANQAIVQGLKEGQGSISAAAILQALPKSK